MGHAVGDPCAGLLRDCREHAAIAERFGTHRDDGVVIVVWRVDPCTLGADRGRGAGDHAS